MSCVQIAVYIVADVTESIVSSVSARSWRRVHQWSRQPHLCDSCHLPSVHASSCFQLTYVSRVFLLNQVSMEEHDVASFVAYCQPARPRPSIVSQIVWLYDLAELPHHRFAIMQHAPTAAMSYAVLVQRRMATWYNQHITLCPRRETATDHSPGVITYGAPEYQSVISICGSQQPVHARLFAL